MDKRYQVFISSTFTDLQNERAKVQKTIMQLDCIPAGMELFPAIDEEQLEFIKRVIDDSDYYLLIIGGRYGSMAKDGISYTEKEYDYAISKGIKVIALLHKNPESLPLERSERDAATRKKLLKFRAKASTGRVVSFWNNEDELPSLVALSLPVTIKTYPAVGWVRASSVPGPEVYKELNDLRKENDKLKDLLSQHSSQFPALDFAGLHDSFIIKGSARLSTGYMEYDFFDWQVATTWGELFAVIAPTLFKHEFEDSVNSIIAEVYSAKLPDKKGMAAYYLTSDTADAIRVQFRALDLINVQPVNHKVVWSLSGSGEKLFIVEKAIRKPQD